MSLDVCVENWLTIKSLVYSTDLTAMIKNCYYYIIKCMHDWSAGGMQDTIKDMHVLEGRLHMHTCNVRL